MMKLVIFGLTISSSWGNGHATLWRGLCRALARRGHRVVFFERDVPYYAAHRDLFEMEEGQLVLYPSWEEVEPLARRELDHADAGMITSYCPDSLAAMQLMLDCEVNCRTFYDMDTPVTLDALRSGREVAYIGPRGLRDFDLVLSYTGGKSLDAVHDYLGAQRVAPLYGSVDPQVHRPVAPVEQYRSDLSYLGTYSADRQQALQTLFIDVARQMPERKFLIGGALYPEAFPWTPNIFFARHLPPGEHPAFYCSSRLICALPDDQLSFLLFPVAHPEYFDAVVYNSHGGVQEIQVKQKDPSSHWIWGAFKMPGSIFHALYQLWRERDETDEYIGTLINAYLDRGGKALAVRVGESYVDVGTLNGYREAIRLLGSEGRLYNGHASVFPVGHAAR